MTRHPANSYIGLPWLTKGDTREGVSCWGLVALYHREQLLRPLPNYLHAHDDVEAIRAEIAAALDTGQWLLVTLPEDGDVVTMSRRDAPNHLGVCAAGHVLHITEGTGSVVAQTPQQLTADRWGHIRFWRRAHE